MRLDDFKKDSSSKMIVPALILSVKTTKIKNTYDVLILHPYTKVKNELKILHKVTKRFASSELAWAFGRELKLKLKLKDEFNVKPIAEKPFHRGQAMGKAKLNT